MHGVSFIIVSDFRPEKKSLLLKKSRELLPSNNPPELLSTVSFSLIENY